MIVGIIIVGIAIALAVYNSNFKKDALTANGVVIGFEESSAIDSYAVAPVVRFNTAVGDTIVFTSSPYTDPPAYELDEEVTVLYNPELPHKAKISGFLSLYLGSLILFVVGLCIAIPSYFMFTTDRREMKELEFYLRNGSRVEARLVGVEEDTTVRVNDKHPFYIIAEKNINGKLCRYKSKSYLRDPSPYLKNIETVVVYKHPFDRNKYLMDLSFIPY